jgi:hypothetical protein
MLHCCLLFVVFVFCFLFFVLGSPVYMFEHGADK